MGLVPGIVAILVTSGVEVGLLTQLGVFKTAIGLWVLVSQQLVTIAILLMLVVVGSFIFAGFESRRGSWDIWIIYYGLIGLACFLAIVAGLNNGLNYDVKYSTYASKAAIDFLSLQYLNGAVVWTTFLLAALFMLSDPRISYAIGPDGKRHLYMHSKVLGLIRLLRRANLGEVFRGRRRLYDSTPRPSVDWDAGEGLDHAVVSKNGTLKWNDRFQVSSPSFLGWTSIKFLLALAIAAVIASDVALRLNVVQNYLGVKNSSWIAEIQNYFGILGMRLGGAYQVSPSFGVDNAFTFEVFALVLSLLGLAFTVIGIRLGISLLANAIVGLSARAFGMSRRALSNFFAIIALAFLYSVLGAGSWVYDVGSSFILWTLILLLAGSTFVALFTRSPRVFHIKLTRLKALGILVIVILSVVTLPAYASFLRAQSGQYVNYQWNPAYVPTIQYTRWAYGVDNVTPADVSLINSTGPQTNVLGHVRIFTQEAARLNMKPLVGVNWMSLDTAPVDIIYRNGTEYWVSILQLVQPTYGGDTDVWRTQHLLLTHSEKILAVNAATTERVDAAKIWPLTQTPQVYYGEGGLWQSVDEVYLNIPGFTETHLANYSGPPSYSGSPDYTFDGFWRYWKFFWQGRLDFASGNYGPIKALEFRDLNNRLSNLLLPNMQMDPDPYPVVDPQGNIYLLHWVWIDWPSPSGFADYPEHNNTSILRLFSTVLTDVKTGEIRGYLYDNGKSDYVTSFYRSMYPKWNQPIPSWLGDQLRYPETFFNIQQSVYNFYFQTDPNQWQRNVFLQSTEDTRFIITPLNGNLAWSAVRLVEIYKSPSQNLAGLYVAPAGTQTGHVYLIRFPEGKTLLGPTTAESAVSTDPTVKGRLTLHPEWTIGNILLYLIDGRLIYVIPYYGTVGNLTVPVMVAVVNAETKQVGVDFIDNPNLSSEVAGATTKAINSMGIATGTQLTINGTLTYRYGPFDKGGNAQWIIGITPTGGTQPIQILARYETLTPSEVYTLITTPTPNGSISVVVDNTFTLLKIQ